MKKTRSAIDFETALNHGGMTYTGAVGDWWTGQCNDAAHRYAYRKIVDRLSEFLPVRPKTIVEYACGPGLLLGRLMRRFPEARLMGIDGSPQMLDMARRRLQRLDRTAAQRVELVRSHLPNFELPAANADLVVFAFPNICPAPDDQPYYDRHGARNRADRAMARRLAEAREPDPDEETVFSDPVELATTLIDAKVIARNLRGLVRRGGWCMRVEYSTAPREQLSELVQMRLDFEAGSLDRALGGCRAEKLFRFAGATYRRSSVIEDVWHQTGEEEILNGGYLVSFHQAV